MIHCQFVRHARSHLDGSRLALVISDDVDFLVDDFSAFALLPSGAAVSAGVLMPTGKELNVSGKLLAKTDRSTMIEQP